MVKKSNNPLSLDHEYVYTIISIIILLNVFKLVLFFIIICTNITLTFPKNGNDVIYSPSSSSKPEHKGRYYEECGKQSSSGALLTSIVFISTMEVNDYGSQWCPKSLFSKYLPFVFGRTKIFIQVWNYLRVSKWWQCFNFWVNYPFN